MTPLKLALLLRAYAMPRPNQDIPAEQAYAPAMVETINSLRQRGLLRSIASPSTMRIGYAVQNRTTFAPLITEKGKMLVERILSAATDMEKEAS